MRMIHSTVKTTDVKGVPVKNEKGEDLGKIEDIVLDKLKGDVKYVALSYGGFLGMGNKLFAMPWNIFHYDPQEHCFRINIDKQKLESSPGFDKEHWPERLDGQWLM